MVQKVQRPKSILKIPTEIGMKCTVDGMRYPRFTKHSVIGDSACSCHIVNDNEGMEDVESIDDKIDEIAQKIVKYVESTKIYKNSKLSFLGS